jgi:cytochrome c-type biogenesis protein CcmF
LSVGIALGSWWAYYELGWGGYWFWDAVENASFMPWLMGTALIHSLAVTDKRGLFKSWTLLLAIGAFSLSLLGTFLVRSGVLVSVHSFAADPERGLFILAFLIIVIGGALTLYAWRAPKLISDAGFEFVSRESFLLFNNILLVVATAVVFGGTLAPLISDALDLGTLSVGTPYFNPSFMVPVLPLLALMGLGIHAQWRRGRMGLPAQRLALLAGVAVIVAMAIMLGIYGSRKVMGVVGASLSLWIIVSTLYDPILKLRKGIKLSAATIGMTMAHIGIATLLLGITLVESQTIERDMAMRTGQSVEIAGYTYTFKGGKDIQGPNYDGYRGHVTITRNGKVVAELDPEKRRYLVQGTVLTEAGIGATWNRDLFVALGEDVGDGAWSLRLQYRPLIRFIWLGALIIALGGITTLFDKRFRAPLADQT